MTETKRARIRAVKKDEHASKLLKVLRATGLFRWEKRTAYTFRLVKVFA